MGSYPVVKLARLAARVLATGYCVYDMCTLLLGWQMDVSSTEWASLF